jgi:hypothetical protein
MHVAPSSFILDSLTFTTFENPVPGENETWNYDNGASISHQSTEQFYANTDPAFMNSAIYDTLGEEFLLDTLKSTLGLGFHDVYELFGPTGRSIVNPGISFPARAYSIAAISGKPTDSLWVLSQDAIYTTPDTYLAFPTSSGAYWSTVSTERTVKMKVRVAALAGDTDFQRVSYFTTTDSVVGWGTVQTPAAGPTPVLMVKVNRMRIDSFYLNGAPVAPFLLSTFHIPQQNSISNEYSYQFFAQGLILPLLKIQYSDSNYSQESSAISYFAATDGVASRNVEQSDIHLYPNPTSAKNFYLQLSTALTPNDRIEVADVSGKAIESQQMPATLNGTLVPISLPASTIAGTYFIRVSRANGSVEQTKAVITP